MMPLIFWCCHQKYERVTNSYTIHGSLSSGCPLLFEAVNLLFHRQQFGFQHE
jgi:hypothetical protein